jgi:hypothetical protein
MEEPLPSNASVDSSRRGSLSSIAGKCPRCGSPMEEGYAVFGSWVNWVKERGTLDAALWKRDKLITYSDAFTGPTPGECDVGTVASSSWTRLMLTEGFRGAH